MPAQVSVSPVAEPAVTALGRQHEREVLPAQVVLCRVRLGLAAHDHQRPRDVVEAVSVLATRRDPLCVLVQTTLVGEAAQVRERRGQVAHAIAARAADTRASALRRYRPRTASADRGSSRVRGPGRYRVSYLSPPFTHLRRLTDEGGLYEHAQGITPRREHGYCLDDVARALVVVSRETEPDTTQDDLRGQYLSFVLAAQGGDGRFRNRRDTDLSWHGPLSVEDCWGRGLWGLGAAVSGIGEPRQRDAALTAFERGAGWRSPHSRAMAFAALGAAEVLRVVPEHRCARDLIATAAQMIGGPQV